MAGQELLIVMSHCLNGWCGIATKPECCPWMLVSNTALGPGCRSFHAVVGLSDHGSPFHKTDINMTDEYARCESERILPRVEEHHLGVDIHNRKLRSVRGDYHGVMLVDQCWPSEVESLQHGFQHAWLAGDRTIPVYEKIL